MIYFTWGKKTRRNPQTAEMFVRPADISLIKGKAGPDIPTCTYMAHRYVAGKL